MLETKKSITEKYESLHKAALEFQKAYEQQYSKKLWPIEIDFLFEELDNLKKEK